MRLITKTLAKRFAQVGRQEESKDPIIIAHFFNPTGVGDWYATEYDSQDRIIFGYAIIHVGEWGYTSLDELASFKGRWQLGIERDLYWSEKPASAVIPDFKGFGE